MVAQPEVFALVFAVAELSPEAVSVAAEPSLEAVSAAAELSPEVVVLAAQPVLVAVSQPVLAAEPVWVVEPELLVASESVPDVAELLASGGTAVVFVVLIPVSVALVEADSSGHPRFFAFPNTCSFPKYSSSSGHGCRESVHSSTGVHTNHESRSILSNPGLHQNKNLEHCYNNPSPGYNNVNDTNDLPKNATTNHSRNRSLHQCQE